MNYLSRREHVTSPHNPLLKEIRRAAARGGLTSDGLCLAEGMHLLEEALRSGLEIAAIVATENAISAAAGAAKDTANTRFLTVDLPLFHGISTTESPHGVIALVRPPEWTEEDIFRKTPRQTPLIIVLDGVQDPGNAGTLMRAAEAFSGCRCATRSRPARCSRRWPATASRPGPRCSRAVCLCTRSIWPSRAAS
jgi:TrmH family RNA methyltransferase